MRIKGNNYQKRVKLNIQSHNYEISSDFLFHTYDLVCYNFDFSYLIIMIWYFVILTFTVIILTFD